MLVKMAHTLFKALITELKFLIVEQQSPSFHFAIENVSCSVRDKNRDRNKCGEEAAQTALDLSPPPGKTGLPVRCSQYSQWGLRARSSWTEVLARTYCIFGSFRVSPSSDSSWTQVISKQSPQTSSINIPGNWLEIQILAPTPTPAIFEWASPSDRLWEMFKFPLSLE